MLRGYLFCTHACIILLCYNTGMKHKFTSEECKKGGKSRAFQAAAYRREHPTSYELQVRIILDSMGVQYQPEYHLQEPNSGIDFFLDIAILQEDLLQQVIEIDGSNDWHNHNYTTSKMYASDELKMQLFHRLGIPLLRLQHFTDQAQIENAIKNFLNFPVLESW